MGGWFDERGLSNVTLQWMMDKVVKCRMLVDKKRLGNYQPNPHGKKHESYSGFWKFRGSHIRKIPERASIHRSVAEHMRKTINGYRPKNFLKNTR